jgi:glycosyltransferase involved in cell wall biosynthesis
MESSIVILAYKCLKYIVCIFEIYLNQSYKCELIIVNNSSADNLGGIIKKYLCQASVKRAYLRNVGENVL